MSAGTLQVRAPADTVRRYKATNMQGSTLVAGPRHGHSRQKKTPARFRAGVLKSVASCQASCRWRRRHPAKAAPPARIAMAAQVPGSGMGEASRLMAAAAPEPVAAQDPPLFNDDCAVEARRLLHPLPFSAVGDAPGATGARQNTVALPPVCWATIKYVVPAVRVWFKLNVTGATAVLPAKVREVSNRLDPGAPELFE